MFLVHCVRVRFIRLGNGVFFSLSEVKSEDFWQLGLF